jgi:hypothetical protein
MKIPYKTLSILLLVLCFSKKILVIGMIVLGAIFFPEASKVLRHYCFGDGSQLEVSSEYIKTSPVVKKQLARMKVGEKRKNITLNQCEDWRLSYAINGFTLEKRKHKIIITQWIKFKDNVKTDFFFFTLPDNIVHTFECTPFMFHSEWEY